jgi:hypothetical protein
MTGRLHEVNFCFLCLGGEMFLLVGFFVGRSVGI